MKNNKNENLFNTPSPALRIPSLSLTKEMRRSQVGGSSKSIGTLKVAEGQMRKHQKGFTLIELLVVVLIIGILAAVAVPQYKKAVLNSHFTQFTIYLTGFDKAIDAWILANGTPTKTIYFTGDGANAGTLDIDLPCESQTANHCYTKIGRFAVGCASSACWIDFGTAYTGYKGPFPSLSIETSKYLDGRFNGRPILSVVPSNTNSRKIMCQLWATHYGKERMSANVITSCEAVGI